MTRVYYKEAVGAFIVFDVTRSATFDAVVKWKQDLDSKVQLPNGSPIPCILLANKVNIALFLYLIEITVKKVTWSDHIHPNLKWCLSLLRSHFCAMSLLGMPNFLFH